jgi:Icc protein
MLSMRYCRFAVLAAVLPAWLFCNRASAEREPFQFIILGDRTGDSEPGVYQRVWQEAAAQAPAFLVSVGDSIEGLKDSTAEAEWLQLQEILALYRRYPLFLAPGNHDIWSSQSAALFQKYAAHPPHYSFDYRQVHITVLDNSRSEQLSPDELQFLQQDLQAHQAQPVKFIVFHRPSWLLNAILQNTHFALHQLAKKYGVRYVVAGHLHQMFAVDLEGVTYLSMVSSGGHLRGTERYEDGWFFGYALIDVEGSEVDFHIKEIKPPRGRGRVTGLKTWHTTGPGVKAAGSP